MRLITYISVHGPIDLLVRAYESLQIRTLGLNQDGATSQKPQNLTIRLDKQQHFKMSARMKISLNYLFVLAAASILLATGIACTSGESEPAANSDPEVETQGDFLATAQSIANQSASRDTVVAGGDAPRTYTLAVPSRRQNSASIAESTDSSPKTNVAVEEPSDNRLDSVGNKESVERQTVQPSNTSQSQLDTPESSDGVPLITQSEILLTNIWESTIDGVVLITIGTDSRSFFPSGGSGAGWFWDEQGHIITNYHVIQSALRLGQPINVSTFNGDEYVADYVGGDEHSDIAVLKIDADSESYVALATGDSSNLIPGMTAIALGHPFGPGQAFSMTQGIISGLARSIQSSDRAFDIPGVIQTDTDMNPGNSGGPLLNSEGHVIGVNTQIRSLNNTNSGVGFAVPINLLKRVVPNLIETGRHEYSVMGVNMLWLTPQWRVQLGLPPGQRGVYISRISTTGPAADAGLRGDSGTRDLKGDGDIIVSLDGVPVDDADDLRQYLVLHTNPGDEIEVGVLRDGELVAINLTLASRNPATQ